MADRLEKNPIGGQGGGARVAVWVGACVWVCVCVCARGRGGGGGVATSGADAWGSEGPQGTKCEVRCTLNVECKLMRRVQVINFNFWIPFGDHPLNLERYRED